MRKSLKRIMAGVMVSAMAVTSLAGCGSSNKEATATTANQTTAAGTTAGTQGAETTAAETKEEPVQMEWLVGETSAEVDDNAEVVKMIEERFNIDLKTWYVDCLLYTSRCV